MSRLTRRALFALPVALPVAAVAAKVEAVVPAPVVRKVIAIDVDGAAYRAVMADIQRELERLSRECVVSAARLRTLRGLKMIPIHDELAATLGIKPPQPVVIGIDAGGNDDKVAVAVVQPAQPVAA